VEDLERNTTRVEISDNVGLAHSDNSLEYEDDNVDAESDSISFFSLDDPHLKHISNGRLHSVMTCLDCRVEKAIQEVQDEMRVSLVTYCESNRETFSEGHLGETTDMKNKNINKIDIPDIMLTSKHAKQRKKKGYKATKKEDRKKRRKVLEDLIRLEGELNTGMGNYAVAFDTHSDPVSTFRF
jgi:hypothetical protein